MTVDTAQGGGAVQPYDPTNLEGLGLEDVGASDMTIPRITINHGEGTFKNNLSGEEFETLRCVMLGVIKQRIMWDKTVDDGDKPMCKSPDFEHGFPNVNLDGKTPPEKQFPWARSNFSPSDYPADQGLNGLVTLPCSSCIFKEWDKGDWKQPPCSEQHTYPLLYDTGDGSLMPALFSVQKTGIKPSRTYLNVFIQSKSPMFTVYTEIILNQASRGTVKYSVPKFMKKEATEETEWGAFGQQYRSIREFIRQPPRRQDEEGEDVEPSDNVNRGPETPAQAPAATVPAAAPVVTTVSAPAATVPAAAVASSPTPSASSSASATPATPDQQSSPEGDDDLPF